MKLTISILMVCACAQAAKKPDAVISLEATPAPAVARSMTVAQKQIPAVNVKLWNETWLVFPDDESVVSFAAGDLAAGAADKPRGNFIIEVEPKFKRILSVKPSIESRSTNLHVLTNKGNTYSFLLNEVSGCKSCKPDLKVFVERDGQQEEAAKEEARRKADYEKKIDNLTATVRLAKQQAAEVSEEASTSKRETEAKAARDVSDFKVHYPEAMHFGYSFARFKKPFEVEEIWNDGTFTWIKTRAQVVQTIYAEKIDGVSLVQFEYKRGAHGGVYIISGIVTAGYLQAGKKRLHFHVVAPPPEAKGE